MGGKAPGAAEAASGAREAERVLALREARTSALARRGREQGGGTGRPDRPPVPWSAPAAVSATALPMAAVAQVLPAAACTPDSRRAARAPRHRGALGRHRQRDRPRARPRSRGRPSVRRTGISWSCAAAPPRWPSRSTGCSAWRSSPGPTDPRRRRVRPVRPRARRNGQRGRFGLWPGGTRRGRGRRFRRHRPAAPPAALPAVIPAWNDAAWRASLPPEPADVGA